MPSKPSLAQALGIPDDATQVVVCEMSAHLDWDWQVPFLNYFQTGGGTNPEHPSVQSTLKSAISLMSGHSPTYRYSICEMSYLRQFLAENPTQREALAQLKDVLTLSGAGITSSENLVTHGEAFIRNYLLGREFAQHVLGHEDVRQLWIPDDFGSDAQLPIVVKAMGYEGASFWRIPGDGVKIPCSSANTIAPATQLRNGGVDFTWVAREGSSMGAHWLYAGYCQGNSGSGGGVSSSTLTGYVDGPTSQSCAPSGGYGFPTRYQFVPIDCDFEAPYSNLGSAIETWNEQNGAKGSGGPWIVQASYQDYVDLRDQALEQEGRRLPQIERFVPNPYWSGCYASHPGIKQAHFGGTRALLAAEPLLVILGTLQSKSGWSGQSNQQGSFDYTFPSDASGVLNFWAGVADVLRRRLEDAWQLLVVSTHHDFIPGTVPDQVYRAEQRPRVDIAQSAALDVLASALRSVAQGIAVQPRTGELSFCVYNPVAAQRSAPVRIELPPWLQLTGARVPSTQGLSFQRIDATGWLVQVPDAPSLGYTSLYATTEPFTLPTTEPSVTTTGDLAFATSQVSVVIDADSGDIEALYDLSTDPQGTVNLLPGAGNEIVFYYDNGGIYQFGMEVWESNGIGTDFQPVTPTSQSATVQLLERGPLRFRARAVTTYELPQMGTLSKCSVTMVREYELIEGEPVLRMRTTGAAPAYTSVMVRFGLGRAVQSLEHGTAVYWDDNHPRHYFDASLYCNPDSVQMTFEATHGYVQAKTEAGDRVLGFLHAATPAWAIENPARFLGSDRKAADAATPSNVVGCILRNTPTSGINGAAGSDSAGHSVDYAVVVPSALSAPSTGGPQLAAALYNGPLVACEVPVDSAGTLPETLGLVSTSGSVLVTAAKPATADPGQAVLRVLQLGEPVRGALPRAQVTLGTELASALGMSVELRSALERKLAAPPTVTIIDDVVTWIPDCAVSTLVLG